MSMSISVNVHHPEVQQGELGVYRNEAQGHLVVSLSSRDRDRSGSVILFVTDEEWDAITARVDAFRESEDDTREWYPGDDEQRYPAWMERGADE